MDAQHLIEPQNLPTWTVAAFVLALLSLVLAFAGIYRSNVILVGTQTEVLMLNKKIDNLAKKSAPATVAPAPAAQAAASAAK